VAFKMPFLAFGRAVLYYLIVFVFALAERKKRKTEKLESTLLPQAKGHVNLATTYVMLII